MAAGKAIDTAVSQMGHWMRQGRKPTATALRAEAQATLDDALDEVGVDLAPSAREAILAQVAAVLRAYRQSEIVGLARPKTRVILINNRVGVYAQPDFWDGRARIYEMKTFLAWPPKPEVALQLRLFQLAFPRFEAILVCFDRHRQPVETTRNTLPPPTQEERAAELQLAYSLGIQFGQEKVLEYLDGPFEHYSLSPAVADGSPPAGRAE